jgi:hypothetical protein
MDKLSVNLAVSTVLQMVRSPEFSEASTEALRALDTMALTSRAEAALIEATFGYEFVSSLSVSVVAPRKIQVRGTVGTEARRTEAEQALRAVKGVDAVENLIEVAQVIPIQTV